MLKGKVVGNIVSTNKLDKLIGFKFLEVRIIENDQLTDKYIVAVDRTVSAGIGEEVLVTVDDDEELDNIADYFDDLFSQEIDYDAQ